MNRANDPNSSNSSMIQLSSLLSQYSSLLVYIYFIFSGSKNLLSSSSCTLSLYHLVSTFIGILLTFSPMHFLGFNVMPRRIPQFPDSFHSWNFLSSIGSGITFLSFAIFIILRILLFFIFIFSFIFFIFLVSL